MEKKNTKPNFVKKNILNMFSLLYPAYLQLMNHRDMIVCHDNARHFQCYLSIKPRTEAVMDGEFHFVMQTGVFQSGKKNWPIVSLGLTLNWTWFRQFGFYSNSTTSDEKPNHTIETFDNRKRVGHFFSLQIIIFITTQTQHVPKI